MRRAVVLVSMILLITAPAPGVTNAEALKLFDRMAKKLELTAEQRSEIFFLLGRERRGVRKPLPRAGGRREIRNRLAEEDAARQELRRAVARPSYDETLVRDRACRLADAELAASLLARRRHAELGGTRNPAQASTVVGAA